MVSTTQTYRRDIKNESRIHTRFTGPSRSDHDQASFKELVPIYKSVRTGIGHHPGFEPQVRNKSHVSNFINPNWKVHGNQTMQPLVRYRRFGYDPSIQESKPDLACSRRADVNGVDRFRYSDYTKHGLPSTQTEKSYVDLSSVPPSFAENPAIEKVRTVETQTVYRDSEVQTGRYSPVYIIHPGEAPELLTLGTLSYSLGLPAGLAEVKIIEQIRYRRAWEASLPPLSDLSQAEKRRTLIASMETNEWSFRECQIEKIQAERLQVKKELLKQRENIHQMNKIRKLDKIWAVKQKERESKIHKIQSDHVKGIHKLTKQLPHILVGLHKKSVVQELIDPRPQLFVPLTNIGSFLDHNSPLLMVRSKHLCTYQGLLELESSLPDFVLNPRISKQQSLRMNKSFSFRMMDRRDKDITDAYDEIKKRDKYEEMIQSGNIRKESLKWQFGATQVVTRPQTPQTELLEDFPQKILDKEKVENELLALTMLQQVIRGRAIQDKMFEGKVKHLSLINEVKATRKHHEECEEKRRTHIENVTMAEQKQRTLHEHKESLVDESLARLESESLGKMFDFLTKELVRLQEERRIHAFAIMCGRERRMMEAAESRTRQEELRRRSEEDYIFKNVIKSHQCTVDTYLNSIINDSIHTISDEQARRDVQAKTVAISRVANEMEQRQDEIRSDEIVADLVYSFLIPEVSKVMIRNKVHESQKKFILAAHREIYGDKQET